MHTPVYDLFIIGGGVNGAGIARDAAGRGLKVALAEMGDLAQGTSSASTKLIHGGLRYLEHYAFRLVREALAEREVLLTIAPHVVWPLRFVLPQTQDMRPAWMLRLGLFIYDHIGGRKTLPPARTLDLRADAAGAPLDPGLRRGYEYSDCRVDDARLVILNAMDAARRGADIRVRTHVIGAMREGEGWRVRLHGEDGQEETIAARALVNASGAWANDVAAFVFGSQARPRIRLVKGSHIVVTKLFDHDRCYIFQNRDGRIIFAIPYENDFTLIGTTDVDYAADPAQAAASDEEIDYLLSAVARYFIRPPGRGDIRWTFSGVRALYDDGASAAKDATREYMLDLDAQGAPLLHIHGGKITTYRKLAEAALAKLQTYFPQMPARPWTGDAPLPGGDFPPGGKAALRKALTKRHPWLDTAILDRMIRSYGTMTGDMIGNAKGAEELGPDFGFGLHECEVRWMMDKEWARTADDVLWRRSKLGLRFGADERDKLARYMGGR